MKILDFLKENKIGTIVGGLYALLIYFNFDNILFYIITNPIYWFHYLTPPYDFLAIFFGLIFIGAYVQKLIKIKKWLKLGLSITLGVLLMNFLGIQLDYILHEGQITSRCSLGSELLCIDYQISDSDDEFRIRLKNSVGESVEVQSISLSTEDANPYICTNPPSNPTNWQSGTIRELKWTGCTGGGLVANTKGRVLITINYYTESNPSTTKEVKGEVLSSVI